MLLPGWGIATTKSGFQYLLKPAGTGKFRLQRGVTVAGCAKFKSGGVCATKTKTEVYIDNANI